MCVCRKAFEGKVVSCLISFQRHKACCYTWRLCSPHDQLLAQSCQSSLLIIHISEALYAIFKTWVK